MEADTKHCSACNERLPHDAVFCSACGTAQKAPPNSAAAGAFALVEDQPHTTSAPATPTPATPPPAAPEPPVSDSIELESVQLDDGDLDDGLLEEGEPEADEIELEEISLEDDEESEDEGTAVVKTAEPPPTEAAVPAASKEASPAEDSPAEESEETSNTVRMSMSDVMQAWNEEGQPDGDAEPASDEPAAPAAKGLPPGFVVALLASLAVVALLVYFLT